MGVLGHGVVRGSLFLFQPGVKVVLSQVNVWERPTGSILVWFFEQPHHRLHLFPKTNVWTDFVDFGFDFVDENVLEHAQDVVDVVLSQGVFGSPIKPKISERNCLTDKKVHSP